jgi:hypothetical protein
MQTQSAHVKLGLHAHASSSVTLPQFITQLDKMLQEQHLEIVNGPHCLKNKDNLLKAQQEIQSQSEILKQYGVLCGTTSGLIHLLQQEGSEESRYLDSEEVREYYKQLANLTISRVKCTCDGLSAVALKLAKILLNKNSIGDITIQICPLSNWSHTLLRLTKTKTNGTTESVFYDPWYQRCYTQNPADPKIFPEENLGLEMNALIQQTAMIRPTTSLLDIKQSKMVENASRDFSYFVACSSGEFKIPAVKEIDPTKTHSHTSCVIC